jgi:hypothetical protein
VRFSVDRVVVRGLRVRPDASTFAGELQRELQLTVGSASGGTARSAEALRLDLPVGSSPAAGIADALGRVIGARQ